MKQLLSLLLWALSFAAVLPCGAQQVTQYARPGQPTMTIYVMGGSGDAGIWQVERNIDFIEFLTLLNVARPLQEQQDRRTKIVLRLYRGQSSQRDLIYEASLEKAVRGEEPTPTLTNGDVLIVEPVTRSRLTVRTISSIISAVSGITLLAIRFSNLGNR